MLAGTYEVAWCVDMTGVHVFPADSVKLWAGVVETLGGGDSSGEQRAGSGGAGGSGGEQHAGSGGAGGSGGAASAPPPSAEVAYDGRQLQLSHLREAEQRGRRWGWLRGPTLTVRPQDAPATVAVRCYSHSNSWKSGMIWAFAQLLPPSKYLPPLGMAHGGHHEYDYDEEGMEREAGFDRGPGGGGAAWGPWGCAQQ